MSINEIIASYNAAKEAEKVAKATAEKMKAMIIEAAKGAELFTTDIYTVTLKTSESVRLDTKALYKDFPDIKAEYGKVTSSVTVNAMLTAAAAKKTA